MKALSLFCLKKGELLMKLIFRNVILLGFILLFVVACSSNGSNNTASTNTATNDTEGEVTEEGNDQELQLDMSVTVNESSTWYEAAQDFADKINDETDGRITIEVFANEQLSGGDQGKAVEMLSKGNID